MQGFDVKIEVEASFRSAVDELPFQQYAKTKPPSKPNIVILSPVMQDGCGDLFHGYRVAQHIAKKGIYKVIFVAFPDRHTGATFIREHAIDLDEFGLNARDIYLDPRRMYREESCQIWIRNKLRRKIQKAFMVIATPMRIMGADQRYFQINERHDRFLQIHEYGDQASLNGALCKCPKMCLRGGLNSFIGEKGILTFNIPSRDLPEIEGFNKGSPYYFGYFKNHCTFEKFMDIIAAGFESQNTYQIICPKEIVSLETLSKFRFIQSETFGNRSIWSINDERAIQLHFFHPFPVVHKDFIALMQHAKEPLVITCDMSLSEAISLNKLFIYDASQHKKMFYFWMLVLVSRLKGRKFFELVKNDGLLKEIDKKIQSLHTSEEEISSVESLTFETLQAMDLKLIEEMLAKLEMVTPSQFFEEMPDIYRFSRQVFIQTFFRGKFDLIRKAAPILAEDRMIKSLFHILDPNSEKMASLRINLLELFPFSSKRDGSAKTTEVLV